MKMKDDQCWWVDGAARGCRFSSGVRRLFHLSDIWCSVIVNIVIRIKVNISGSAQGEISTIRSNNALPMLLQLLTVCGKFQRYRSMCDADISWPKESWWERDDPCVGSLPRMKHQILISLLLSLRDDLPTTTRRKQCEVIAHWSLPFVVDAYEWSVSGQH